MHTEKFLLALFNDKQGCVLSVCVEKGTTMMRVESWLEYWWYWPGDNVTSPYILEKCM